HQYGFIPHRSTADAHAVVVNFMERILVEKTYGVLISLAVSGAFDNAWWPEILKRLANLRIPRNWWLLCRDYFMNRSAVFSVAGATAYKDVTKGCPQGSICGPSLWNILYDEILETDMPHGCSLIAFADDLMLLCESDSEALLEMIANECLRRIERWSEMVRLHFNPTKTQVMLV